MGHHWAIGPWVKSMSDRDKPAAWPHVAHGPWLCNVCVSDTEYGLTHQADDTADMKA